MAQTDWENVFLLSKANGGSYDGDKLPVLKWAWPKNTFLQKRLAELAARNTQETSEQNDRKKRRARNG